MTDDELKMIRERAERDVDEDSPPRDGRERLTRAVCARLDRAVLLGEVERLRALLARLAAEEHEAGPQSRSVVIVVGPLVVVRRGRAAPSPARGFNSRR